MRSPFCGLAAGVGGWGDKGSDPCPGTQPRPLSPSQPERGRFVHFHSVTFWVGNAKQVRPGQGVGRGRGWARGPPDASGIGPWEGRVRASAGTSVEGQTLWACLHGRGGPRQEPRRRPRGVREQPFCRQGWPDGAGKLGGGSPRGPQAGAAARTNPTRPPLRSRPRPSTAARWAFSRWPTRAWRRVPGRWSATWSSKGR